jgi:hypothetical protein
MALIGDQLIEPESGWRRIDDQEIYFVRDAYSAWTLYSHASAYQGSYLYASIPSGETKINFNFIGTKIRIIDVMHQNRGISKITIDGIEYTYSSTDSSSGNFQRLVFELLDLPKKRHNVTISYVSGTYISLDAIDIDLNGRLLHPDEVTDLRDISIGKCIRANYTTDNANTVGRLSNLGKETNEFIPVGGTAIPAGDFYYVLVHEDTDNFFTLIPDRNIQHSISPNTIATAGFSNVDGVIPPSGLVSFVPKMTSNNSPYGVASSSSLYADTDGYRAWRAFDKTDTGWLHARSSVVGSWIRYGMDIPKVLKAYAIQVGTATSTDAPQGWRVEGSNDNGTTWETIDTRTGQSWSSMQKRIYATPNNEKAFKDHRVIITANGGGAYARVSEVDFFEAGEPFSDSKVRLMSGGINSTDKNNEWDKYIVNSNLNGTVQSGNNAVWNWQNVSSITLSAYEVTPANKVIRGGTSVVAFDNIAVTVTTANSTGFRPLLKIKRAFQNRSFIKDNEQYKKWSTDDNQWRTVSYDLPSDNAFLSDGMQDLSILDRKATEFVQTMSTSGSLGSGRVFTTPLNLKKYIEITNLSVK